MPNQKTVKTYFTSLNLENVRRFGGKFYLDLIDENGNLAQWTLLLGDNGVGKTTLLQCLGWMRPVLVDFEQLTLKDDADKIIKDGFLGAALQNEENEVIEQLRKIGNKLTFEISAEMYQGTELEFGSPPEGKKITTNIKYFFDKKTYLEKYKQLRIGIEKRLEGTFTVPTIVAYGANRQLGHQNIQKVELEDTLAINLSIVTELYDAEERLTKLHHATIDKELGSKEHNLLDIFRDVLARVLPGVKSLNDILINPPELVDGDLKESTVKVRTSPHTDPVPLSNLSLGYQTTAAWALDLAWRLFHANPNSDAPLDEPAIVLIDEIDLHLHPQWQIRIMWDLAKIFKKTQFIATAHSPLMVQSMPNANFAVIRELENNEIKIENEPDKVQGWGIDQILNSQYFDVNVSNKPKTQKLFKERNKLLLKSNRSHEDEKRLQEIEEQILSVGTPVILEKQETFNSLRERKENKK